MNEIICRAVSVMQEAKTGSMRRLQEGCDLGREHNRLPTCERERESSTSGRHWKNQNPGSLLSDWRRALLKPSSTFLKQRIWTGLPGGCPWHRPPPGCQKSTSSTPRSPTITAFSFAHIYNICPFWFPEFLWRAGCFYFRSTMPATAPQFGSF